jgi:hypothetical protein
MIIIAIVFALAAAIAGFIVGAAVLNPRKPRRQGKKIGGGGEQAGNAELVSQLRNNVFFYSTSSGGWTSLTNSNTSITTPEALMNYGNLLDTESRQMFNAATFLFVDGADGRLGLVEESGSKRLFVMGTGPSRPLKFWENEAPEENPNTSSGEAGTVFEEDGIWIVSFTFSSVNVYIFLGSAETGTGTTPIDSRLLHQVCIGETSQLQKSLGQLQEDFDTVFPPISELERTSFRVHLFNYLSEGGDETLLTYFDEAVFLKVDLLGEREMWFGLADKSGGYKLIVMANYSTDPANRVLSAQQTVGADPPTENWQPADAEFGDALFWFFDLPEDDTNDGSAKIWFNGLTPVAPSMSSETVL